MCKRLPPKFWRQYVNYGPGAFYRDIPMYRLRQVKKQLLADGCKIRIRYKAPNMYDAPKWLANRFSVSIESQTFTFDPKA